MPFDDDAQVRTRIEMADEEALSLQLPPVDDRVIGKRMALGRRDGELFRPQRLSNREPHICRHHKDDRGVNRSA
jgi:hypothetical protein